MVMMPRQSVGGKWKLMEGVERMEKRMWVLGTWGRVLETEMGVRVLGYGPRAV